MSYFYHFSAVIARQKYRPWVSPSSVKTNQNTAGRKDDIRVASYLLTPVHRAFSNAARLPESIIARI